MVRWGPIFMCLAVWVCLKQGSKNMVLVGLLQIGAKDFTVPGTSGLSNRCIYRYTFIYNLYLLLFFQLTVYNPDSG